MTNNEGENTISPNLYRLIDANLNRLREGIRVVEDIQRFIFNNKDISKNLKKLRHLSRIEDDKLLLTNRDILNDVLKSTTKSESSRENLDSVIKANIKRAQESSRVLEESLKIINDTEAEKFKNIRYELYNIEKEISEL